MTRASAKASSPTRLRWAIVSVAGIVALEVVATAWLVVNLIGYLVANGNATPTTVSGKKADLFAHDWIGHLAVPTPWWFFAADGLLVLVVAIVCWSPARQYRPTGKSTPPLLRTTPGFLAILAAVHAVWQSAVIGYYDGLLTVFSTYGIGIVLCSAAAIVSFRRFQLDQPGSPTGPPRASVLSRVLAIDLVAFVVIGPVGVFINQFAWLSGHGFVAPPTDGPRNTGLYVWQGLMPISLPWWVMPVLSVVMLAIVIGSWSPRARWGERSRSLRRTTPGALLLYAFALAVFEESIIRFYTSGTVNDPAVLGVGIAAVTGVIALVRWFFDFRLVPTVTSAKLSKNARAHG